MKDFLYATISCISILSNSAQKNVRSLVASIARELAELTGEYSQLREWALQHPATAEAARVRQTFFNWIDKEGWKRSTSKALTQDCRLTSRPLSCRLRLRAITWVARFQRDLSEKTQRQMVLLLGYEECSRLLHFQLFRGMGYPIDDPAFPLCNELPVSTIAFFVEECAQLVGLPIQCILFTQRLFPFPALAETEQAYLSLTDKQLVVRNRNAAPGDNELLCGFAIDPPCQPADLVMSPTLPLFEERFRLSNSTELTEQLSAMTNHHNEENALPKLERARKKLDALVRRSSQKNPAYSSRGAGYGVSVPPFLARQQRHDYLSGTKTLQEVRLFKRTYRNFEVFPGDCPSKAPGGDSGD